MTAKTRWSARLTIAVVATATITAGTLVTAAPAHADRAQDCEALLNRGLVEYRLYEWYGVFLGYDSKQAQGHLKAASDGADFWMVNC